MNQINDNIVPLWTLCRSDNGSTVLVLDCVAVDRIDETQPLNPIDMMTNGTNDSNVWPSIKFQD